MPSPELIDGVLPTGSFDITMLESGVAYVANNFAADTDSVAVRRKNSSGRPSAQRFIEAWTDGSADLQLALSTTARPKIGMSFLADEDGDGTSEPFVVSKVGKAFEQDGEQKLKVSISRCVAPVIYGSVSKTTAQLYAGISFPEDVLITPFTLAAYLPPDLTLTAATWVATGLPTGMAIDATTGVVSGTPTTQSTNYVRVTVAATRTVVRNGALVTETITGCREFIITITA